MLMGACERCAGEHFFTNFSLVAGESAVESRKSHLFTRNVGNRDLRCFLRATFQRLRGGGGFTVSVSCDSQIWQRPEECSEDR